MDDYLGDFKDVADEIKVDEPISCPTYMDEFWEHFDTLKESAYEARKLLDQSVKSDEVGEINKGIMYSHIFSRLEVVCDFIKAIEEERRV